MYNLSQLNLLNEIILGTNYYQKDFYFSFISKPILNLRPTITKS